MLIERIFFNVLAFLMFILVFAKMVQKNDSNFIIIIIAQAIGIAISFFELLIGKMEWTLVKTISYILAIGLPIMYFYLEKRNINLIEKIYIYKVKIILLANNHVKAKKILINLVTKYPESYLGHKLLAQIYEKEGRNEKSNR